MAELLKATFLGFFLVDEGSNPVLQPRTQTYMADPLISEVHKVLKALNAHNALVLARMFNLSLQTTQAPKDWCRGKETPVAKKTPTTDLRQFRLISITSVVCKNLETILKEKLLPHFSQLTTTQHGFLPRRSTVTNLLSLSDGLTKGTQLKMSSWISPNYLTR